MIAFKIGYFKGEYCKGRKLDQYNRVGIMNKANNILNRPSDIFKPSSINLCRK